MNDVIEILDSLDLEELRVLEKKIKKKIREKIKYAALQYCDLELLNETWVDIPNCDGYKASNLGRIKSFRKNKVHGKIIGQTLSADYFTSCITVGGKEYNKRVHRLVAETFLDNPKNLPYVNHIDGNKLNNRVDNLEWICEKGNIQHAHDNEMVEIWNKTKNEDVKRVRELRKQGFSVREITEKTGVGRFAVHTHVKDIDVPYPKRRFTSEQIREIRYKSKNGQTQISLASEFNVSRSLIKDILNYKSYKDVI